MRTLPFALVLALCGCTSPPSPAVAPVAEAAVLPPGDTSAERRELFVGGIRLYESADLAGAEPLLAKTLAEPPPVADHALRHLARIAAERGDAAAALSRWKTLHDSYPDSIWAPEASLALARERFEAGDLSAAERLLPADLSALVEPAARGESLWLESRIARARGQTTRARDLIARLRERYAGTSSAREAAEEAWSERATVALANREAAGAEITRRLAEGDAPRAHELLREAKSRFRATADQAALAFLESRVLRALGRTADADKTLVDIRKRFPGRPEAAEALYRIALGAWNRDEDAAALRDFAGYVRAHPHGPQASESLYAIGRIHQEAGRFDEAIRAFSDLRRRYPRSDLAPEAAWRIGWCEYRAGRHARAVAAFASAAKGDERPGALYWRARALEEQGKAADAVYAEIIRHHPETWYALLAETRTRRSEGHALAGRTPPPPSPAPLAANETGGHFPRYRALRELGLPTLARLELEAFERARGASGDPAVLAAWLEVEGFREVVARAAASGACRLPAALFSYCYPLAFWTQVRAESTRHSIDPYLVVALMRQESLFDPRALSPANARGLMQLLPSTAERTARANRLAVPSAADLFAVEPNLRIGVTHLRELLDRYDGNEPRALAAYNAGAAAVEKWNRRYPGVEDDEFIESISYRETRDYVKRVLRNRRIYRALYSPDAAGAIDAGPSA